jgi:DNA-binding NarL/FixJ family response regulator
MANLTSGLGLNREEFPVPVILSGVRGISVLLADAPSVFQDGLRAVLSTQPDLSVVAESPNCLSMLDLAARYRPDIILFEPEGCDTAFSILRGLQASHLPCRVILLTATEDAYLLSQCVRFGVAGIVPKKSPTELLLKSIRKVNAGELWLDRVMTADLVRQLGERPIPAPRNLPHRDTPVALSRREREVTALVSRGFRNREIADKLFISEQTVKNHMHNIFEKVGVTDRLELALYAIYHRIFE